MRHTHKMILLLATISVMATLWPTVITPLHAAEVKIKKSTAPSAPAVKKVFPARSDKATYDASTTDHQAVAGSLDVSLPVPLATPFRTPFLEDMPQPSSLNPTHTESDVASGAGVSSGKQIGAGDYCQPAVILGALKEALQGPPLPALEDMLASGDVTMTGGVYQYSQEILQNVSLRGNAQHQPVIFVPADFHVENVQLQRIHLITNGYWTMSGDNAVTESCIINTKDLQAGVFSWHSRFLATLLEWFTAPVQAGVKATPKQSTCKVTITKTEFTALPPTKSAPDPETLPPAIGCEQVTLLDSTFTGYAKAIDAKNITVQQSTFQENRYAIIGPDKYYHDSSPALLINESVFEKNGIALLVGGSDASTTITESKFTGHYFKASGTAAKFIGQYFEALSAWDQIHGAVEIARGDMTISYSEFDANQVGVAHQGGGMIHSSIFTHHSLGSDEKLARAVTLYGGEKGKKFDLIANKFADNHEGVVVQPGLNVVDSEIPAMGMMDANLFSNHENIAVAIINSTVNLKTNTFQDNSVALLIEGNESEVQVVPNYFHNNIIAVGLWHGMPQATLEFNTFENNSAGLMLEFYDPASQKDDEATVVARNNMWDNNTYSVYTKQGQVNLGGKDGSPAGGNKFMSAEACHILNANTLPIYAVGNTWHGGDVPSVGQLLPGLKCSDVDIANASFAKTIWETPTP